MSEEQIVEDKRKTLEDFLKEKSTITFDDEVWNVKENLKNIEVWLPATSLTSLGMGIYGAYFGGNQVMIALFMLWGIIGVPISGMLSLQKYISRDVWKDHLVKKKEFGKKVEDELPSLLDSLDVNPNKESIYDFLHAIKGHVKEPKDLLDTISIINLKGLSERKYEQLFKAMSAVPKKYVLSSEVNDAINYFDKAELEKKWTEIKRLRSLSPEKKGSYKYFDLPNTQKVYLHLLSTGWEPKNITHVLEKILQTVSISESFMVSMSTVFMEQLIKLGKQEKFFLDMLQVYDNLPWMMNEGKKNAIVLYLFEKKDKLLVSRLAKLKHFHHLDSKEIYQYLDGVDQLPGVGIKGQINALIKLGDAINVIGRNLEHGSFVTEKTLEDFTGSLENLLSVDYSSVDESIIGIIQFLKRHPNIDFDKLFPKVFKYYMYTQGRAFKSDWMKKEVHKVPLEKPQEQPRPEIEGLLDARGERKFLEELDRKVELARFEAFNRAIEDVYYAPLDDLFGKRVNRSIEVNEEMINVIKYFNDSHCYSKEELGSLLKAYFDDPSKVNEYLDNLPGNKALEGKIKGLLEWKKGLIKIYDVGVSGKLKEKIEEEVQSEYSSFLRCVEQLEEKVDVPKDDDKVRKAEATFEILSKIQIPQDKQYLLLEAKHHLTKLKSQTGMLMVNSQSITFYDSKNPIESMNMGVVSHSCTNITGGANDFASLVDSIDANKKVIYMKTDEKVGRTLAILTDKGVITYRKYDSTNLATDEAWIDYFQTYARQVGVPLIVPKRFVTEEIEKALKARGAKSRMVRPTLQRAVCDQWYDDQAGERVKVPESGYTFTINAYVLR